MMSSITKNNEVLSFNIDLRGLTQDEIEDFEPEEVLVETFTNEIEDCITGGEWDNDGIGAYEYWGFPGNDEGTDYFIPEHPELKVVIKGDRDDAERVYSLLDFQYIEPEYDGKTFEIEVEKTYIADDNKMEFSFQLNQK